MPVHHATQSRAAKFGAQIVEFDGKFYGKKLDSDKITQMRWDDAKTAGAAVADPETVWIDPSETPKALKSGVMTLSYHQVYTINGGGCGDTLDAEMRAFFTGTDGLDVEALEQFGREVGLWNPAWGGLNPGMKRMNLANRLRGYLRRNPQAEITIGDQTGRFGVTAK